MQETPETQVWSLCQEYLLEKEIATHSTIPAWKIPRMGSRADYSPWDLKESDTTEHMSTRVEENKKNN